METDVKRNPVELTFVGLDLSLTGTGICVKRQNEVAIETFKTTPKSAPNDLARLQLIVSEVMKRIPSDVTMVCVEDYFTPTNRQQIGAAIKIVALGTIVRMALYEAGIPFFVISPSQLKKFITGKGNSQKSLIIREVYKKYGYDCKDDNQADASVLAHMAEAIVCYSNPDINLVSFDDMLKPQQETISKVVKERPNYNVS